MKLREPSCDGEHARLAQRMAKLEEKLFGVMERNAQLEEENARLHEEVARLHEKVARLEQQLAAARKDSSTSSKPPSSDIVKPKKPPAKGGKKRKKGGQPGHEHLIRDVKFLLTLPGPARPAGAARSARTRSTSKICFTTCAAIRTARMLSDRLKSGRTIRCWPQTSAPIIMPTQCWPRTTPARAEIAG
jgi:hypothetical protein